MATKLLLQVASRLITMSICLILFILTFVLMVASNQAPITTHHAHLNEMPDAPIQLLKPDERHKKLVLVEENLKYLAQIDAPIAIVSVVGPLHSGKSFLMNQLMKKKSGFGVGPSVKPTTMGIWMWGKPAIMQAPDDSQNINVIFLDTEGFAANNVSENYDAKIFAVTTLLSSHLLFNSVKIVNQADIDYLEVLSRQTQLFALRSQMTESEWLDSLNEDLLDFPPLTWVVQDFVQETESGESSTQWLHRLMSAHMRENDDYKLSLLDIFKEVYCHTLFLPATQRSLLQNLNTAAETDLTPEYRAERDQLIARITQHLKPKSKGGRYINGVELSHLLRILVGAANDGNLTSVPSRWETFMQNLVSSSVTACVKYYDDEMEKAISELGISGCVKSSNLQKAHKTSLGKSQHLLTNLLKGLPNSIASGQKKLEGHITLHFDHIEALNSKKVENQLSHNIREAEVELEQGLTFISMPMPSKQLEKETEKIVSPIFTKVNELMSLLLESEQLPEYKSQLAKSLSRIVAISKAKNSQEMSSFFKLMIDDSLKVFNKTVDLKWQRDKPLHPSYLLKVKKFAEEEAFAHFGQVTLDFKEEPLYQVMQSHLLQLLGQYSTNLDTENEQLAESFISQSKDSSVIEFKRRTSPETLQMPLMDDQLEEVLRKEANSIINEFKSQTSEFEVYKSYYSTIEALKEELSSVQSVRKQENINAFTKEVIGPFEDSVGFIKISESKYSTVFSFRRFIEDVYLEVLKKGKPASWPNSLKLKIIANFVENNEDLSALIAQKDSLWSRIFGLLEWIIWCITKFFTIIYRLFCFIMGSY